MLNIGELLLVGVEQVDGIPALVLHQAFGRPGCEDDRYRGERYLAHATLGWRSQRAAQ